MHTSQVKHDFINKTPRHALSTVAQANVNYSREELGVNRDSFQGAPGLVTGGDIGVILPFFWEDLYVPYKGKSICTPMHNIYQPPVFARGAYPSRIPNWGPTWPNWAPNWGPYMECCLGIRHGRGVLRYHLVYFLCTHWCFCYLDWGHGADAIK